MRKLVYLLVFVLACYGANRSSGQSTIFTYQGRLADNGGPANGLYDFRFSIYKVQTNGLVIAGPLTNTAVAVNGGLFTIPLDFGQQPFLGVNRYLDIAVRTNGSANAFIPIFPRVRIASAPYAIAAANIIDGGVTAASLSPGPGADGQVLQMSGGVLTWGAGNGSGSVTSVGTGLGLLGGPITASGTVAVNPAVVPLLGGNQTFAGSNTFTGVSFLTNANNRFTGAFFGNGAGLSNITATATNSSVTLAGDVTGSSTAATVARIRNVNVLATPPTAGQLLRFSGTDWTPAPVTLSSDVTGTLADARLSGNVALLNGNQTFSGSNTFNGASSMTNVNNRFTGVFTGNGASLTTLNAGNVSSGVLADARLSGNVPLLNGNQTFAGSNTFAGVSSLTNANNRFTGAFFGNGAGLSNITATATNSSVTLAGDVTGSSTAATVARIRNVNVLATPPTAGQLLRYSGTDWTPAPVTLSSDVTGILADARLSGNVALLNGNQLFSGSNTFNGVSSMTNVNNRFTGVFTGNGASLTTLNAANVSSGTLADARLSANVPLLNGNQTFAGSNTFAGVSSLTNANNRFTGAFFGNGAGLSNITATATNSSVTLAGDVTGPSSAATVARIRNVNVLATPPTAGQHLRFSGTDWTPAPVALGTDVTGTLVDARLSTNVPLLNGNQTFTGSNTFNGVSSLANASNKFAGVFFGNGAGLSNIVATATNGSVTLGGDVTGLSSASTVARIRNVTVSATPPAANQLLRYNGTSWTPGAVALGSDITGTLPVANGGTAATTAVAARASLGAAAGGANADITSLSGLTTPLSATQGGSGQSSYAAGDLLYASAPNTLNRRAVGTNGQVLSVSNALPVWTGANNHNHFGQVWTGVATDGLFLQNTSIVAGASALTAASWATSDIAYGIFGQTASSEGIGVEGFAFATTGLSTGVFGESTSTNGTGVYGFGSASSGQPIGIYGEADAPAGIGVYGIGAATNGTPVGVYGTVSTPGGYGLYTPNRLYVGESATVIGALNVGSLNSGAFSGSGSNLTSLNASNVTSGTLADARLSTNVALRNASQTFTGANSFSPSGGPPFAVNNTNRVINLNADLVDGLNSAQFLRSDTSSTQSVGNLTFASGTRLLAAAGTAAAPGISFSSSTVAGIYSPAANVVGIATASTERLRIAADGKTGIGRSPTANTFEVEGTASKTGAGGWLANSDGRIKTGVETLDHALETIDRVRPVSFHYTDEYRAAHPSLEDKTYCNVIAQEFAKVFPEAVKESGETLDGKPILQVDIHPAAVYAIAAIQELHELVKSKNDELAKLKQQNTALEKRLEALEKAVTGSAR